MGKATFKGFVPKDDPMLSTGHELFSRPGSHVRPEPAGNAGAGHPLSASDDRLPQPPDRAAYSSEDEFEEAQGGWRERVGRIRALREQQEAHAAAERRVARAWPAVDRRTFLGAMAALGLAAITKQASSAEVDDIWAARCETPYLFFVDDDRIIRDDDEEQNDEPSRAELFRIDDADLKTVRDLVVAAQGCNALSTMLDQWAATQAAAIKGAAKRAGVNSQERSHLLELAEAAAEGCDATGVDWLESQGEALAAQALPMVVEWLRGKADGDDVQRIAPREGPAGYGLDFFSRLDVVLLNAMGVELVHGDHPGSSFNAARLRHSPTAANEVAVAMGIPIRFWRVV